MNAAGCCHLDDLDVAFGMGGGMSHVPEGSMNYYLMHFLESMSIIAVNLFVLITRYFMVGRRQVQLVKALDLIFVTVFYGSMFYLAAYLTGESRNLPFDCQEFIAALNPFIGSKWFVVSYVILFMLSPFINRVLEAINKINLNNYWQFSLFVSLSGQHFLRD